MRLKDKKGITDLTVIYHQAGLWFEDLGVKIIITIEDGDHEDEGGAKCDEVEKDGG